MPHRVVVRTLNLVIGTAACDREKLWLDRAELYLTSAFKHFKYEPRGKRRIHQKPNVGEIQTCKRWLDREIDAIRPRLIVALGATAARALAGRQLSVTKERGHRQFGERQRFRDSASSFLLRLPDENAKQRQTATS